MDYINDLYEMCETISNEITEANEKIRNAGGKLTAGDVDYIDKLTHSLKSIKATIAMMEDDPMYSNRGSYADNYRGGSYRSGRSSMYRGRSYAPKRDSMGRYSSDDGMISELRELMDTAPNETVKRDIQRLMDKIEQM